MPGEGQLAVERKDADPVVCAGLRERQQERRFRQVQPAGDPLHGVGVERCCVVHDRQRVAGERAVAEHVDEGEGEVHVCLLRLQCRGEDGCVDVGAGEDDDDRAARDGIAAGERRGQGDGAAGLDDEA